MEARLHLRAGDEIPAHPILKRNQTLPLNLLTTEIRMHVDAQVFAGKSGMP
jgi:hypothetical protein